MRIIKLITPSNETYSIEISGDEAEIRDLISALIGVSPNDIKGIKDKYGNYFTLSFASKNQNINSDFSEVYYLVCSNQYNNSNNNSNSNNNNNNEYEVMYSNNNSVNNFNMINNNNNKSKNKYNDNRTNHIYSNNTSNNNFRYQSVPHYSNTNNNFNNNNNMNNNTNDFMFNNNNNNIHPFNPNSMYNNNNNNNNNTNNKFINKDKNLFLICDLERQGLLYGGYQFDTLKYLVNSNNEEICYYLDSYYKNYIGLDSLVLNLNKISSNNSNNNNNNNQLPSDNKVDFKEIFSGLEKMLKNYFEDNELKVLRQLVNYENNQIIKAINLYQDSFNIEVLISSMKIILIKYNNNNNNNNNNIVNSKSNNMLSNKSIKTIKTNTKSNTNKDDFSTKSDNRSNNKKAKINNNNHNNSIVSISDDKQKDKSHKTTQSTQSEHKKLLDDNRVKKISEYLHTEQKIIFKYGLYKRTKELQMVSQMARNITEDEELVKFVKVYCKNFIDNVLMNDFSEVDKNKMNSLLINRNDDLRTIFKDFHEHKTIDKLKSDMRSYLKTLPSPNMNNDNNNNNDSNNSIEQDNNNNNNNNNNINQGNTESPNKQDNNEDNNNNDDDDENQEDQSSSSTSSQEEQEDQEESTNLDPKVVEFIKLIQSMQNIPNDQKEEVINLIKAGEANEFMEEHFKSNSIFMLKKNIKNLLKNVNSQQPNDENGHDHTNYGIKKSKLKEKNKKKTNNNKDKEPLDILMDLLNNHHIEQNEFKFLQKQINRNTDALINIIEDYKNNNNHDQLISSVKLYFKQRGNIEKTPEVFNKRNDNYIDMFKTQKILEKEEIKKKQINIITMLSQEDNFINEEATAFVKEMIEKENQVLCSAFEIFSISRDHWDFCETITTFCNVHFKTDENGNNNGIGMLNLNLGNMNNNNDNNNDSGKPKMTDIMKDLGDHLTVENIKILDKLLEEDHPKLKGAIDSYKDIEDDDDFIENLEMIINKFGK